MGFFWQLGRGRGGTAKHSTLPSGSHWVHRESSAHLGPWLTMGKALLGGTVREILQNNEGTYVH